MRMLSNIALKSAVAIGTGIICSPAFAQGTEITFLEPFVDDTGLTAQSLSEYENITLTEARQRLVSMADNSRTAYLAGTDHNDEVAGTDVTTYADGSTRLKIYVKMGRSENVRSRLKAKIKHDDALSTVDILEVPFSAAELEKAADDVLAQTAALRLRGAVKVESNTGTLKFVTPDESAVEAAVASGSLVLPEMMSIEYGPEIVPTGISWGGGTYLNMRTKNCTAGFTALHRTSSAVVKGVISADHCGTTDGYVDTYNTVYSAPSALSARVITHDRSFYQDFQFLRFVNQSDNQIRNTFWDGVTRGGVVIRGGAYAGTWSYVCKWGRSTGRTCGYVAYSTYRTQTGTYYQVYNRNASGAQPLARSGDSGGPVFMGNMIIGIVYGGDSAGNMYISPATFWKRNLPNVFVYCTC